MNVELWERYGNTVFIKRFLDLFVHVKVNGPVILCFAPRGGKYVYAAVPVLCYARAWGRIFKNKRIGGSNLTDQTCCLFKVIGIRYRKGQIDTARGLFRVVNDLA